MIKFILLQTKHIRNGIYINSYFEILTLHDDKKIEEIHNNDFNLSEETKKCNINENIFHTSDL